MRDNLIKTACVIGLLVWSLGTFAKETSTSIIEVGEPAPKLMPRFESTSSRITFENQEQTVVGILTEPKMDSPYPIVLLFHGFTGQKNEGCVSGTGESMYGRTARVFAEQGIASLRIDFRGSGESIGGNGVKCIGGNGVKWEDTTFSGQISDALAAIEYATKLPRIDPERIGLLGFSQGGLVAASTAARDARIDSLVLWAPLAKPYATFSIDIFQPKEVKKGLELSEDETITAHNLKRPFFEDLLVVDPIAEIVRFTNPLLVIVGLRDDAVAPQPQMGKLYLRYHEGQEALVMLDTGHLLGISEQSTELDKAIAWSLDWFTKTLKKGKSSLKNPKDSM